MTPSAEIEITSAQADRSAASVWAGAGTQPRLLTITSTMKATRKKGSSVGRFAVLPPAAAAAITSLRNSIAITSTTGTSIATRNILASEADLATSGEMMLPAPTTCATSWMAPPRNRPASGTDMPSQFTHSG